MLASLKTLFIAIKNNKAMLKHSFLFFGIVIFSILWLFILDKLGYVCPFRLLHLWCPGCGGTRMVKSILKFDFYQAFRYNPLIFILILCFLIYLIIAIIIYFKRNIWIKPSLKFYVFLVCLLIVYMILRNIPYFSYLIPTEV